MPEAYRYEWSLDEGRTWEPTGDASLSVTIPDLSPGTYRFRVRGRNAVGPGAWSTDSVEVEIPATEIVSASDLVIGQWTGAARLRAVIDIVADVVREEVEAPLLALRRQRKIETAEGVWLDAIGRRLGVARPYTTFGATDDRFGFDEAGVPFDVAPFRGEASNDATVPLADVVFRRIIRARAITVLSDGSLDAFRRAVLAVDPAATVDDRRNMTVAVTTSVRWQLELADQQKALPRVAGVLVEYRDRGRFGFDEAGVPFDAGPFRRV